MFKVGQKVVCIDDAPPRNGAAPFVPLRLVAGRVYTIRSIHTEPHLDGYGVRLDELLNPPIVWDDGTESEWSYQSERFRSVVAGTTETVTHETA